MTKVIAHRGASAAHPENTIEAFAAASHLGAEMVELDVRRSRDGVLVVHHDAGLSDGRVIVATDAAAMPVTVPTLAAALDACRPLPVNIEIKNLPPDPDFDESHRVADEVVALVADRDGRADVLVSSFNPATVNRVRAIDAAVPTAVLVLQPGAGAVEHTAAAGHTAFHPHEAFVDADLVRRCHDAGLALNAWTVDDPDRIAALAAMGVDGVVTNVPDVAARALGR